MVDEDVVIPSKILAALPLCTAIEPAIQPFKAEKTSLKFVLENKVSNSVKTLQFRRARTSDGYWVHGMISLQHYLIGINQSARAFKVTFVLLKEAKIAENARH